jgi:large subunit ribosomal protein L23
MHSKALPLMPRLSEKAYMLSKASNTFLFDVPKSANKHTVARAVHQQFGVTVKEVNMANISGKNKRTVRRSGRAVNGSQNDLRKAYVKLQSGDSLPFFEAAEEAAEKQEKTQEQMSQAMAKQEAKESKPNRRGLRRKKDES